MNKNKVINNIKELYTRFDNHEVSALGAQLAYYLFLSFFPFLIFVITIIGYFPISIEGYLIKLSYVLPNDVLALIRDTIENIVQTKKSSFISLSIISTLWIASKGIGSIIRGLNKAYDIKENRPFWKVKGISVLFTIVVTIIIIFTFSLLIFEQAIMIYLAECLKTAPIFHTIWDILRYIIMILIMTITFAIVYRHLPNHKLIWKEVLPGAVFTSIGWLLTSLGFAYYVNKFANYSKIYGSIGGVIVLLIWLFFSGMVILIGGEINAILLAQNHKK